MTQRPWLLLAAALLLARCGGGDGPGGPALPTIHGSWALQGDPDLVVDSCQLDKVDDIERPFAEELSRSTGGTLDFSQEDAGFTILDDFDGDRFSGTLTPSGSFRSVELVQEEDELTIRIRVEGAIAGDRMTGRFVAVVEEDGRTCNVAFAFEANRVGGDPAPSAASPAGWPRQSR